MDLLRRLVARRIFGNLGLIIGASIGKVVGGERGACAGDIVVTQEGEQPAMRRHHRVAERRQRLGAQLRPGRGGHRRGHRAERRIER
jgi:hypothetical protein